MFYGAGHLHACIVYYVAEREEGSIIASRKFGGRCVVDAGEGLSRRLSRISIARFILGGESVVRG